MIPKNPTSTWRQELNWWAKGTIDPLDAAASFCTGAVFPTPRPGNRTVQNRAYVQTHWYDHWRRVWAGVKAWTDMGAGEIIIMQNVLPIYAAARWYRKHDPTTAAYWNYIERKKQKIVDRVAVLGLHAEIAVYLESHPPPNRPNWAFIDTPQGMLDVTRAMIESGIRWDIGHPYSSYRERYVRSCEYCCDQWWGSRYASRFPPPKPGSTNTQIIVLPDGVHNPGDYFDSGTAVEYALAARKRGENVTFYPNGFTTEKGEKKREILAEQYTRCAEQMKEWFETLDPHPTTPILEEPDQDHSNFEIPNPRNDVTT